MRLFIAVTFDAETLAAISQVRDRLRAIAQGGRYAREEILHLTLVFLGEVEPDKVGLVKQSMDSISAKEFELVMDKAGVFHDGREGALWWVGMQQSSPLDALYARLRAALSFNGFVPERRAFTPHVTIARDLRMPASFKISEFSNTIEQRKIHVGRFCLLESKMIEGRLNYIELHETKLRPLA